MSQAASQAWAFYREVAKARVVWTVRDDSGFPTVTTSGKCAQPFWSSRSRVEQIIKTVPAYTGFEPYEVSWANFCDKWVPDFVRDGLLVGVNYSGKRAVGYDIEPENLVRSVEAVTENTQKATAG